MIGTPLSSLDILHDRIQINTILPFLLQQQSLIFKHFTLLLLTFRALQKISCAFCTRFNWQLIANTSSDFQKLQLPLKVLRFWLVVWYAAEAQGVRHKAQRTQCCGPLD
jgi:hypothetical protein